mmetsp:Transcript_34175/g.97082  ORF Transcript_34175/g.97082 Transcript_34175/m.97082 type:complete len:229 (+) Transcript_34175:874-1560(+)
MSACCLRASSSNTRSSCVCLERSCSNEICRMRCSNSASSARRASTDCCKHDNPSLAAVFRSLATVAASEACANLDSSSRTTSKLSESLVKTWSRCILDRFSFVVSSNLRRCSRTAAWSSPISCSMPSALSAICPCNEAACSASLCLCSSFCRNLSLAMFNVASASSTTRSADCFCRMSLSTSLCTRCTSISAARISWSSRACWSCETFRVRSSWFDLSINSIRSTSNA